MRETAKALDYCYFCPNLCRDACPVADAEQDEASTPLAKMSTFRLLLSKKIPWNKENALQAYKCSDCGQATEACELDNPVAPVLNQFKSLAFKKGVAPDAVYSYCKRFKKRNNPFGIKLLDRLKKNFPVAQFRPAAVTYFPGCTETYQDIAELRDTLELFSKLGIGEVSLFDKPMQCCGYPLLAAGDLKGFREHAEVMQHFVQEYPLIVSGDSTCLFTMRDIYAAHGFPLQTQFLHLSEFLEPHLRQKNVHIKKGIATSVAFHDPCYLGRNWGIYEEPRRLIEMVCGEVLHEFRRNRENTYCCGGGGLLPVTRPKTAETMAQNRLREFEETGANVLVSSCSTCVQQLRTHSQKPVVKGLASFLNRFIETDEKKRG